MKATFCPGNLPRSPDEMQKNHRPSGFTPQKSGRKTQSWGGESFGFARRHCFESMAVLFAKGGSLREIPGQAGDDVVLDGGAYNAKGPHEMLHIMWRQLF